MDNGEPKPYENESSLPAYRLDEPAFERFFKQHFSSAGLFCQSRFGFDIEESKDIVHTAFIKLWENRQTVSNNESLKAYLFRIVVNTSLDVIKHEKTRKKYSKFFLENYAEAYDESDVSRKDVSQLTGDIQAAIGELPEQMRTVFELSRYEGMTYRVIAEQLNISVKTVETQMSRALVKLRQKLGHYLMVMYFIFLSLKFL